MWMNALKAKWIQISLGFLIVIVIIASVLYAVPLLSPVMKGLDSTLYDNMLRLHLYKHTDQARVVIIDIDDESVAKQGRWPWPRDKFAKLLKKVQEAGAVVVTLDIVMSEAEVNYATGLKQKLMAINPKILADNPSLPQTLDAIAPQVDNDQAMMNAMKSQDVVMGFLFHDLADVQKGSLPKPLVDDKGQPLDASQYAVYDFKGYNGVYDPFLKVANGGFVSSFPDQDGTVRRALLVGSYQGKIYPSLAMRTAMRYLLAQKIELVTTPGEGKRKLQGIKLDNTFIPTDSKGQMLIPYWGGPLTLPFYSAVDVMQGKVGAKELNGAIAIIGSSMILLADLHEAPVATIFPGVEMVGNLVSGIVGQEVISEFAWYSKFGIILLLGVGLVLALSFPFIKTTWLILVTVALVLGSILLSGYLFAFKNIYLPIAFPLVLVLLQAVTNYVFEFIAIKRQRNKISELFGQYVPQEYVQKLVDTPGSLSMEGETRYMTAFFTDVRGFTNLSEGLDVNGVKRLLNTFFTPLTEIIFNHQGTIDKYVGDMVMAFWGAPMPDKHHAEHAIEASLEIFKRLPEINQQMEASGLPSVNIGIGLGTGLMNVGDMGSAFRRAYTVLGDTVNLASRLQDLTKFYHVNILVNEENHADKDKFVWRPIDRVTVKGRSKTTNIYQPLGLRSEAPPELLAEIEAYQVALDAYYAKSWDEAEEQFVKLRDANREVYVYEMYLERIEHFKEEPPPEEWDGVFVHLHK